MANLNEIQEAVLGALATKYGLDKVDVMVSRPEECEVQIDVEISEGEDYQTFTITIRDEDAAAEETDENAECYNYLDETTGIEHFPDADDVRPANRTLDGISDDAREILGFPIEPNELTLGDLLAEEDDDAEESDS